MKLKQIKYIFRIACLCLLFAFVGFNTYGQCPNVNNIQITGTDITCNDANNGLIKIVILDSARYINTSPPPAKKVSVRFRLVKDGVSQSPSPLLSSPYYTYYYPGQTSGTYDVNVSILSPVTGCPTITFNNVLATQGKPLIKITNPGKPDAGDGFPICGDLLNNFIVLSGNDPGVGTNGVWSLNGPNNPVFDMTDPFASVSPIKEGDYTFKWTFTRTNCPTKSDSVVYQARETPVAQVGNDTSLCSASTFTLPGVNPGTLKLGTWSQINGPSGAIIADTNLYNSSVSGLVAGVYKFRWIVSNDVLSCGADTAFFTLTNNANPNPPTGASLTPNPVCEGKPVAFSITSPNAATTYKWTGPNGFTFTHIGAPVTSPISSAVVANGGPYSVTATFNGCTSAAVSAGTLVVNLKPATTTITPSTNPVCQNQNLTLTSSVSPVTWILPGGTTSATNPLTVSNIQTSNTYKAIVTSSGCNSDTTSIAITVRGVSTASISASGTGTYCSGSSFTLTSSAAPAIAGAATYNWTTPTGGTVITAVNTLTISNAAVTDGGNYTVSITPNGCTGPVSPAKAIVINTTPVAPTGFTGKTPVCQGEINLPYSVTSVPGLTYTWSYGGTGATLTGAGSTRTISYSSTATSGNLSITASSGACVGPALVQGIVVNSSPVAPSGFTGKIPVCQGESNLAYSVTSVPGLTYTWTYSGTGATLTGAGNSRTISYSATATSGNLVITASSGTCTGTSLTQAVVVNSTPLAPTTFSGKTPVCQGEINLPYSVASVPGLTYTWTYSGIGATITGAGNSRTVSYSNTATSGDFTITASTATCTGPGLVQPIVVNPIPNAPTGFSGKTPVCQGESNLPYSVTSVPGLTYTWTYSGAGATLTGAGSSRTISYSATATSGNLIITASSGTCTGTSLTQPVVVNSTPLAPTTFSGKTPVCQGEINLPYSVASVPGLTYSWTYSGIGATITGAGNSRTVSYSNTATSGDFTITASTATCTGPGLLQPIVVNPIPNAPTGFSGKTPVCQGESNLPYSVTSVPSLTYTWSYSGTGATLTGAGNSRTISYSATATSGNLIITASSGTCTGTSLTQAVVLNSTPLAPTSLTGKTPICQGETGVVYTAPLIAGLTYNWTYSGTGATFIGNTNSISVNFSAIATLGDFSVTASSGTCTGPAKTLSVVVNPIPTAPITPANVSVCVGSPLTIPATLVAGTYSWSGPNSFSASTQNASIASPTFAANGPYNVFVTSGGCKSTTSTTNVTVNALPSAASVISPTSVCQGAGNVVFSVTNNPAVTYSWSLVGSPAGVSIVGATNANSVAASIGAGASNFSFHILTIANGCSTTVTRAITVNTLPAAPVPSASPNPVCVGFPVTINSNAVATGYSWTLPGGSILTTQNISIANAALTNGGLYSLIVTNAAGCKSAAGTINLTVNTIPVVTASNTGPYCSGANLSATASGPAGATYVWTLPSGATFNGQTFTKSNIVLSDSGNYMVVATLNGCSSTSQITNVKINAVPAVPLISATPNSICSGQSVVLSCGNCSGTGLTYDWSGPGFTSTSSSPNVTNITSTGAYSLKLTSNGCSSTSLSTAVTVKPSFNPLVSTKTVTVCQGQTVSLTATSGGTSPVLTWTGPGLALPTTGATITISNAQVAASGKYYVTSTVNGCTGGKDSALVTVTPAPFTPGAITGKTSVCPLESGVAYSVPNVAGMTYTWSYSNATATLTPSGNTVLVNYLASGLTGKLTVSVSSGTCATSTSQLITVNTIPATPAPTAVPVSACVGSSVAINANATASIYAWTLPGGGTASTQNISIPSATLTDGGSYSLIVTNAAGCKSNAGTVNLTVNSSPVITASNTGPYCAGSSLTATASGPPGAVYTWTLPSGSTFTGQTFTKANIALSDSGNYKVVATENGCSSTSQVTNVKINARPATPSVSASPSSICINQPFMLSCSNCTGTGLVYAWSGPGFTSSSSSPTVNNISVNSTYNLLLTSNGCQSLPGSALVTVKSSFKPNITTKSLTICAGQSISLKANSGGTNPTFTWTGPGLASPLVNTTGNLGIANAPTSAAGIYYVTSTVNGCPGLPDSATVIVNTVPAQPGSISGKTPVCQSENNVPYSVSKTPGITYTWTYSNGTATVFGTGDTARVNFSSAATNGTLSVIASNGTCSNTIASTFNVVVNTSPALPVVDSSNSPICIGNQLNIDLVPQTGITFNWVLPSGSSHIGNSYSQANVGVSDAGNYLITARSGICSSAVLTVPVVVNPGFIPIAIANPVCVGGTLTISASGVVAPGATYSWTGPNGFTNSNQSFTIPNAQLADSGTYTVIARVGNCSSNPVPVKAIVNPIPSAPTNITGPTSVCQGISTQTYTVSPVIIGETYTWSYSGTGVTFPSGNTGSSVSATFAAIATSGSIQVSAIANACSSAVKTQAVTINALPVTPGSKSVLAVCQGNVINLNATTVAGSIYTWSGPNGFSRTGQAQTVPNAGLTDAGSYIVTYSLNGCTGDSDTTNVTVNPSPSATFTYAKASYCQSEPNASPVSVPTGSSFAALPAGLFIAPATGLITFASSTPGTYTITNTVTSGPGCQGTSTFSITILKSPIARTFNYTGSLCDNTAGSISPSFTSLGDAGTFSSVAGLTINTATGDVTPSTSTAGTYIVTYSSVAGSCSSATTSTVDILLSPTKPTVTGSQIICQGKSSILTASSGALTNFDWFKAASLVQSGGNTLNVTTAGNYSAVVTGANGCKSSNSDNLLVFVAAKPILPVIQGVCPLSSPPDTLTTQYSTQPGYTYEWLRNKVTTATTPSLVVNVTSSYSAIITETASGCVSDTSAPVTPFTGGVAISVTSGINPFCTGDSLQVASNSAVGNSWSLAGNVISAGTSVFVKSAGQLILTVTNGSCSGKDTLDVTSILSPAKPIISSVSDSLCPGGNVTLSTTASGSFQWLLSSTNIAGQTSSTLNVTTGGAYQVNVSNGTCSATSDIKNIVIRPVPSKPSLNLSGNQQVCQGNNLSLSITNFISGQDQWYFSGSPVAGAVGTASTLAANAAGMYKVVRTRPGSCPVTSDSVDLQINSNIVPGITVAQSSNNVCSKSSVTYTATDNNAGLNPTFQWFINSKLVQAGLADTLKVDTLSKTSIVRVIVTSSNTCSAPLFVADSITTIISPGFKLATIIQNVGCTPSSPGSVNLVVTNSSGALKFTGQLLQANTSITVAGNYNVRITDTLSQCFVDTTVTVGKLSSFIVDAAITQPTCYDSNGVINLSPNPASGTYTIKSGTLTSLNNSNLGEGTYNISIEDSTSLCTVDTSFVLASNGKFNNTYTIKQPDCGSNNGSVTINTTPAGSYTYFGMLNQVTTNNLVPDVYKFTTQNTTTGCSKLDSVVINGKPLFNIIATIVQPLCGTPGEINLSTTPLIGFSVSGDLTTAINPSLSGGSYNVTVTDTTTKCFKDSMFVLIDKKDFTIQADTIHPTCFESNGSITLSVNPTGTYQITGPLALGLNDSLDPGDYNLSIVNPVSGCATDTLIRLITKGVFTTAVAVTQPDCGSSNGQATITPSPAGTYTFTGGGFNAAGSNIAIAPGVYNVIVSNNICSKTDTVRISGKPQFVLDITTVQPLCNIGGSINISTNPAIGFTVSGKLTQANNPSLPAGVYNFTVTDNVTGCFKDTSITLIDKKDFQLSSVVTNPVCFGKGSVNLSVTPAASYTVISPLVLGLNPGLDTGAYNVKIVNPVSNCEIDTVIRLVAIGRFSTTFSATQPVCGSVNTGSIRITPQPAGSYTFEDASGKISSSFTTGLNPSTYFIVTANASCAKIDTVVLNGLPNFGIVASVTQPACPATPGTINISTNPVMSFNVSGDFTQASNSNLIAKTYNFRVTDNTTLCFKDTSVTLNQTKDFVINPVTKDPLCFGKDGSIDLQITPDTGNYIISGAPLVKGLNSNLDSGTFIIKVVNQKSNCEALDTINLVANGRFNNTITLTQPDCGGIANGVISINSAPSGSYTYFDASNAINSSITSGLKPDVYFITTSNGICSKIDTTILTGKPTFQLVKTVVQPGCNQSNGTIDLSTTPAIGFKVSGFGSNGLNQANNVFLSKGTYKFRVTDTLTGCSIIDSVTLKEKVDFVLRATLINPVCFGKGLINLNYEPFGTYTVTGDLKTGNNLNLDSGSYTIKIVNPVSLCEIDTTLKLVAIGRFNNSYIVTQPVCGTGTKGTIKINTTPVAQYTYEDASGLINSDLTTGLNPGQYTIVTSNSTCSKIDTVDLLGIPNFTILTNVTQPGCSSPLGIINISTNPVVNFKVTGDLRFADNPGLDEKTYNFVVTDNVTGCFADTSIVLKKVPAFTLTLNVKVPECGKSNGEIRMNVNPGPNRNYTFLVNQQLADSSVFDKTGGSFNISVTNKLTGCEIKDTIELNSIPDFRITSVDRLLPACQVNNGFIKLNLDTDSTLLTFDLSNGGNFANPTLKNISAGLYRARILRTGTTCLLDTTISLSNVSPFKVNTDSLVNPACKQSNGKIILSYSGVFTGLAYDPLSDFQDSSRLRNKSAGDYRLRLSIQPGACIIDTIFKLKDSPDFSFRNSLVVQPLCNVNNGEIQLKLSDKNVSIDSSAFSITGNLPKFTNKGLAAGIYKVTLSRGGATCSGDTSIILIEPSAPKVDLGPDTMAICNAKPLAIRAIVADTGMFNFSWYADSTLINTTTIDSIPSVSPVNTTMYSVKLVNKNGCSSTDSMLVVRPSSVKLINTSYVFSDDSRIRLDFKVINLRDLGSDSVYIYRMSPNSSLWNKIDSVPAKDSVYTTQVASSAGVNYYKVGLPDSNSCGLPLESRSQRNLFITTRILGDEENDTESSDMNWNTFVRWDSVVVEYQIFRSIDGSPMVYYASGNLDTLINFMNASEGKIQCYRIRAIEKGPNGKESWSNTSCINHTNKFKAYNIFTPNGDGHNDKLFFKNLHFYPNNSIHVFNRWGNKVFSQENYNNDWDGGGLPAGTYYFILDLKDGSKPVQGDVLLNR